MTVLGQALAQLSSSAASKREAKLSDLLAGLDGRNGFTYAGIPVTYITAVTHHAVWACARLLVETISTLPVHSYREQGSIVARMPSQPVVVVSPSGVIEREEFIGQTVMSVLEAGDAFGQIVDRDGSGNATQIELRDHVDVVVSRVGKTGPPIYRIDNKPVEPSDVFHVRGMSRPGQIRGMSVMDAAKQEIAQGLAAGRYGAAWFAGGGHPSAILSGKGDLDESTAKAIKARFLEALSNPGPVVLGQGLEYKPMQSEPAKSQLVEVGTAIAGNVARFFGIPGEEIGVAASGSSVTYANREERAQAFAQKGILPWTVRIERPWSRLLPRPQFVRFNLDGFLRADTARRYQAYDTAIRGGWMNRDEVREIENRAPIADGTGPEHLWPPYATSIPAAPPTPTGGDGQ